MPLSPDRRQPMRRRLYLAVAALVAAGYGLTLAIFYPGIMTFDAKFVYEYIAKGVLGDWQSPVMTVLWGVIDPIAPGPGSMFLLIAISWLLAAVIAFAAAERGARLRAPAQALALALCAFGVLLRPNAVIAAPILGAYIAWPCRVYLKRTAILLVPAMVGFFGLVQLVYYGALGVTRQHPLQTIMVFDLGGISHFTR